MKNLVMAVVECDGKFLLQRRTRQGQTVIEFPGGAVEAGETFQHAAQRELREETGLNLTPKQDEIIVFPNTYGGDVGFVRFTLDGAQEPRMTVPERQQEFLWVTPENMPKNAFYPADQQFITMVLCQEKTGIEQQRKDEHN